MSRNSRRPFTFEFEIFRRPDGLEIITRLQLKALPFLTVIGRSDSTPSPVATVTPRLTRRLRSLLKAMVRREQEECGLLVPTDLMDHMATIVLAAYQSSLDKSSVPAEDLMTQIIEPVLYLSWCAQASAEHVGICGHGGGAVMHGREFIEMLTVAARAAAIPQAATPDPGLIPLSRPEGQPVD